MPVQDSADEALDIVAVRGALRPRVAETFDLLLEGWSEKEIAVKLDVSHHTVHVYVKAIYRHLRVSSRAELMALFLPRSTARGGVARKFRTLSVRA